MSKHVLLNQTYSGFRLIVDILSNIIHVAHVNIFMFIIRIVILHMYMILCLRIVNSKLKLIEFNTKTCQWGKGNVIKLDLKINLELLI